tara:strand:- start:783 stop:1058 length:276 start_codon:yes stop_codon:yes gene_type:complete
MTKVKSFVQFISEENVKHVEDIEISDGSDKELEAEVHGKESSDEDESCARCGEMSEDCSCNKDDYWSTQTYHRVEKGEEQKANPKQEFKKD